MARSSGRHCKNSIGHNLQSSRRMQASSIQRFCFLDNGSWLLLSNCMSCCRVTLKCNSAHGQIDGCVAPQDVAAAPVATACSSSSKTAFPPWSSSENRIWDAERRERLEPDFLTACSSTSSPLSHEPKAVSRSRTFLDFFGLSLCAATVQREASLRQLHFYHRHERQYT